MEQLPLKDIHLPEAVSFWPPAPGWWLLAILLPSAIAAVIYFYKRLTRKTAVKTAIKLLAAMRKESSRDPLQILIELSALLRRVAVSTSPRAQVAGLSGQAWLKYLDASFPDAPFSQGVGRGLADAQYRQTAPEPIDFEALFMLCERWLKQQGKARDKS